MQKFFPSDNKEITLSSKDPSIVIFHFSQLIPRNRINYFKSILEYIVDTEASYHSVASENHLRIPKSVLTGAQTWNFVLYCYRAIIKHQFDEFVLRDADPITKKQAFVVRHFDQMDGATYDALPAVIQKKIDDIYMSDSKLSKLRWNKVDAYERAALLTDILIEAISDPSSLDALFSYYNRFFDESLSEQNRNIFIKLLSCCGIILNDIKVKSDRISGSVQPGDFLPVHICKLIIKYFIDALERGCINDRELQLTCGLPTQVRLVLKFPVIASQDFYSMPSNIRYLLDIYRLRNLKVDNRYHFSKEQWWQSLNFSERFHILVSVLVDYIKEQDHFTRLLKFYVLGDKSDIITKHSASDIFSFTIRTPLRPIFDKVLQNVCHVYLWYCDTRGIALENASPTTTYQFCLTNNSLILTNNHYDIAAANIEFLKLFLSYAVYGKLPPNKTEFKIAALPVEQKWALFCCDLARQPCNEMPSQIRQLLDMPEYRDGAWRIAIWQEKWDSEVTTFVDRWTVLHSLQNSDSEEVDKAIKNVLEEKEHKNNERSPGLASRP